MYRFAYYPAARGAKALELRGAHLLGADGVPVRGEIRLDGDTVVCESKSQDPLALSLLWTVGQLGTFQLETTRLLPRTEPYHLHIELARQRLMRISIKREEWGLFDYPGMEDVATHLEQARDQFVAALQRADDPAAAARLADQALQSAVAASEDMCRFHARVFLARRQNSGAFAKGGFLGANVPSTLPKAPIKTKLADVFDFVRIPFPWREIQPKENAVNYEASDAVVKAYAKAGLSLRGGPVLGFGIQSVPDWLYLWENDYEAVTDFAREHIRRTVTRYASAISNWVIATGLNADSVFPFTFEQIMDLTRMAFTTVRQAAPKAQLVLDLSQPWGEYYARNPRTVPPTLYAEMAVQSGLSFDAFGLHFVYGVDSEGFHLRDLLQISSLIDRLANLGKPILVTALGAPDAGNAGGSVGAAWSEAAQSSWFIEVAEIALSKPYVESVCVHGLSDGVGATLPGCGALREDGTAKPLYQRLAQWRATLKGEGKK